MKDETEQLRYPIGRYSAALPLTDAQVSAAIQSIAELPARLQEAVAPMTPAQLDTPYREGGWTVRQVIHHLPDSHLNGYMRQKLALTEDLPTIRPYDEGAWANLPDSLLGPPEVSVALLTALHQRWVLLLRSLQPPQLDRKFIHPQGGEQRIRDHIGMYAWHGAHHLAHITALQKRKGW
ncbi:bacillithiol transferase BstA [Pontibacter sp. E15-1]|uniref:YfiT family bacillithiol transferase n=1 Tax=Pontibacter sp. E15-1 TaxID=2919918 RepID=UPI001F4F8300|nr:bacillithiol transferase BstA [Pontibacter sp. E15-1]MCJ8165507.1 bacillithiol transferase BstA [Pontibacter sp. E15-1]